MWPHPRPSWTSPRSREFSLEPAHVPVAPRRGWEATGPASRRRALEALPDGGTVLDVGVGGGASSLGLVPKPGLIVGVDQLEGMLELFQASARTAGVPARAVLGTWSEAAQQVEPVDVAVCHHAIYRVAEIEDFAAALTVRARHRVVIELSATTRWRVSAHCGTPSTASSGRTGRSPTRPRRSSSRWALASSARTSSCRHTTARSLPSSLPSCAADSMSVPTGIRRSKSSCAGSRRSRGSLRCGGRERPRAVAVL